MTTVYVLLYNPKDTTEGSIMSDNKTEKLLKELNQNHEKLKEIKETIDKTKDELKKLRNSNQK